MALFQTARQDSSLLHLGDHGRGELWGERFCCKPSLPTLSVLSGLLASHVFLFLLIKTAWILESTKSASTCLFFCVYIYKIIGGRVVFDVFF